MWSLGSVLFFIATGNAPFKTRQEVSAAQDNTKRLECLQRDDLHRRMPLLWDLIERMSRFNPSDRISMHSALHHHPASWSASRLRQLIIDLVAAWNNRVRVIPCLIPLTNVHTVARSSSEHTTLLE